MASAIRLWGWPAKYSESGPHFGSYYFTELQILQGEYSQNWVNFLWMLQLPDPHSIWRHVHWNLSHSCYFDCLGTSNLNLSTWSAPLKWPYRMCMGRSSSNCGRMISLPGLIAKKSSAIAGSLIWSPNQWKWSTFAKTFAMFYILKPSLKYKIFLSRTQRNDCPIMIVLFLSTVDEMGVLRHSVWRSRQGFW